MGEFQIIVLSLPGLADPSIAIAGSRAGAIGVLDLEYTSDMDVARKNVEKLNQYTRNNFGVKLRGDASKLLAAITPMVPAHLSTVILSYTSPEDLKQFVNVLSSRDTQVLLECASLEEAETGEKAGVDGVIAKGHEAGGRVSDETTFVLLQRLLKRLSVPVWAQGGIGLRTAAACYAAGAAGVVLDSQLALTRESPIPETVKSRIAAMDGTETICLGENIDCAYRVCSRLGIPVVKELQETERSLAREYSSKEELTEAWRQAIGRRVGWESPESRLFLMGQDIALAAPLADRFVTVGGIVEAIRQAAESHCQAAQTSRPLAEGSLLALSHGTRYPIVQGPMARVSDTPAFVQEVARKGALPFVAAAWLRGQELDTLLRETRALLDEFPWGVGLLGFLSPEIHKEQVKAVIAHHPPFALIAGGVPGQVKTLEREGISTYLHVPSQGLLRMFLNDGVQRFVFEGRESGGHVGPLCSFVLWETMIEVLLKSAGSDRKLEEYHVLFAGGIHDALSASMVAAIAGPLAELGVHVGVQLGSAYLFTLEAVATGAIVRKYQQEAIRCDTTTLLETGLGQAVRCIDTPFAKVFEREKHRQLEEGASTQVIRDTLEGIKLGRLRIASKGMARNPDSSKDPQAPKLVNLSDQEQYAQGIYLIGQLAALRDRSISIEALHHEVAVKGPERIEALGKEPQGSLPASEESRSSDIAIIGMACLLPKASKVQTYWENILNKVTAITEIPLERWDWRLYYDRNQKAKDKIYSKWGAFCDSIPFNPVDYGMPPSSLPSIEPLQLLSLEVVRQALNDAGYINRPFPRERTSVILGISGVGDLAGLYNLRASLPMFFGDSSQEILSHFRSVFPEWTEDSFPGILPNVIAGRIANRFNLRGSNCTVDAACASSLAAVYWAVKELESHTSDMVIVGGADSMQNPFTYACFSKTQALSSRGICQPLDESADGIVLGEGIVVMVLKRLPEAERDGDRVYAVIKSMGASSDGRDKSLTAPGREGQIRALERAYSKARVSPATVELIEAHATGTTVGDRTEVEALSQVFTEAGAREHSCAIGSVKSMIGHTKATAGVASLMKATLALHHKVLPPTLGVEKPNPGLCQPGNPLYVNTETRPWIHQSLENPRRAGVSAIGFGGTNFHVVLEEYSGHYLEHLKHTSFQEWPSELLVWKAHSRQELSESIRPLEQALSQGAKPSLGELAFTCARRNEEQGSGTNGSQVSLAVVTSSLEDLARKLNHAREALISSGTVISDPQGIYFVEQPLSPGGKIAFLFPGQGSQYVNMLADLAIRFPEIRARFERSNRILEDRLSRPLSSFIFPPPAFDDEDRRSKERALAQTQITQPAMGTADLAIFRLLESFGIKPDMLAGHSYGEYVALCAAGVLSEDDLITLSESRARFITEGAGSHPGTMAAINASTDSVAKTLGDGEGIWIANVNSPKQTIVSGTRSAIEEAVKKFNSQGILAHQIPVSCAFHSPLVMPACDRLKDFISNIKLSGPRLKVFSNVTAGPYPEDPKLIAARLVQHLISRVEFVRQIEAMYEEGARIFVEVGPGKVLRGLVKQILGKRPHIVLISNQAGRSGLVQLQHLLGQLVAQGVPVKMGRIYEGRSLKELDLDDLGKEREQDNLSPTTWLVNGAKAVPLKEASRSASETPITQIQLGEQSAPPPPESEEEKMSVSECQSKEETESAAMPEPSADPAPRAVSEVPAHSGGGADEVMIQYQRLMQRFLDTQKSVMLSFLQATREDSKDKTPEVGKTHEELGLPSPHLPEGLHVISSEEKHQIRSQKSFSDETPLQPPASAEALARAVVASPSGGKTSWDREALILKLLETVSERTGYPQDMLDLDVDLEAELGIDSIKRVEILGYFLQSLFGTEQGGLPEDMEELNRIKTLHKIIDLVEAHTGSYGKSEQEELPASSPTQTSEPSLDFKEPHSVPRFTLAAVDVPPPSRSLQLAPNLGLLVTDDGTGIAKALTEKLKRQGNEVAMVRYGKSVEGMEQNCYGLGDNSPEAIAALVETIRQRHGPIGGLIHLLPLRKGPSHEEIDMAGWREHLQLDVRTLFHLLGLLGNDLKQATGEGGGFVLSATGMGGTWLTGSRDKKRECFPGQGAIPGLLKTLDMEWPEVRVKAVDLNLAEPATVLADHLLSEIETDDGLLEVGYNGSSRFRLDLVQTPLTERSETVLEMDSSWVILVTGGARGITSKVTRELARRYQPTLIIAGRSPLPSEKEPEETSRLVDSKELKAALIGKMQREGKPFTLPDVQAAYRQLLKDREIRSSVAEMRRAGAKVEYSQVDVRDEHAFGSLIDRLYSTYGRLDGVIHGAGVIEDRLLKDKTWESFARVFGTKTESAFILSRKLRPEMLKFLVLFSSVAGRFGNRGQCDYTTANDVINKLAAYLNDRWPGRVLSINWGPWEKAGMVSDEVQRQFAERGVRLVPPKAGAALFDLELRHGQKGEAEVVIGDGPWRKKSSSPRPAEGPDSLPLLQNISGCKKSNGLLEIVKCLDPEIDLYLQDHLHDERPVLPAAMAIELMAEAGQMACPEWKVVGVRNVRVFKGVVLDGGPCEVRVLVNSLRPVLSQPEIMELEVTVKDVDRPEVIFYKASAMLSRTLPPDESCKLPSLVEMQPFATSAKEAYKRWLFHGPRFQCIQRIDAVGERGLVATVTPSRPGECLTGKPPDQWLIDPVILDSGPQLTIVWARAYLDITPLPSSFKAVRLFRPFQSAPSVRSYLKVLKESRGRTVHADVIFFDDHGQVLGMIQGFEATGSKSLNRLAGSR